jgi:hypothetical protein
VPALKQSAKKLPANVDPLGLPAIKSIEVKGDTGPPIADIVLPNHPIWDLDSASGEVQLQLIVPGILLGAYFWHGESSI